VSEINGTKIDWLQFRNMNFVEEKKKKEREGKMTGYAYWWLVDRSDNDIQSGRFSRIE